MISKTIEFEDYNGNQKKRTYYFHMNENEVMDWLTMPGDYTLKDVYENMIERKNGSEILKSIEGLILRSYCVKDVDGESLDKSPATVDKFKTSPAYSILLMELLQDSKKAADFFNGIIPKSLVEKMIVAVKENPEDFPEEVREYYLGNENTTSNKIQVLE